MLVTKLPFVKWTLVLKCSVTNLLSSTLSLKFVMYVAVTSLDPLRVYLHEEGLARFATKKYVENSKNLTDHFMHLTNYSLNKQNNKAEENVDAGMGDYGFKWSLQSLLQYLQKQGVNTEDVMAQIRELIVLTILAGQPKMVAFNSSPNKKKCCFELYGFDVLLDQNLKPWLIEVNLSPSLGCDTPLDQKVKSKVVCDLLNLASVSSFPPRVQDALYEKSLIKKQETNIVISNEEYKVRGGFNMLFPTVDWSNYEEYFETSVDEYPSIVESLFKPDKTRENPTISKSTDAKVTPKNESKASAQRRMPTKTNKKSFRRLSSTNNTKFNVNNFFKNNGLQTARHQTGTNMTPTQLGANAQSVYSFLRHGDTMKQPSPIPLVNLIDGHMKNFQKTKHIFTQPPFKLQHFPSSLSLPIVPPSSAPLKTVMRILLAI